jgi:hypothetical protein
MLTLVENELGSELLKETTLKETTKNNMIQALKLITSAIGFIQLIKE